MKLQVRARVDGLQLPVGVEDRVERDAVLGQRVDERDPLSVLQRADLIDAQRTARR